MPAIPVFGLRAAAILPRTVADFSSQPSQTQSLQPRQTSSQGYFALPLSYAGLNSGPSPGTVVGITLGSVCGFILILWLIQSLIQQGATAQNQYIEGDQSSIVVRRDRRRKPKPAPPRSRRTARSEAVSSVQSGSTASAPPPPRREPSRSPRRERRERVILEETRRTESRPAPPPEMRETVRESVRETVVEGERRGGRVEGDDTIEVIEESSIVEQPRRSRRGSGYRRVDPDEYGGGNYPQKGVYMEKRERRGGYR